MRFSGLSTVRLLFFHLSMLYSLERSYHMQPTLMSWQVKLYLLEEAVSTQIVWSSPQQFVFSFLKITYFLAVVGLRYVWCRSNHCSGSALLPSGFLLVTVSGGHCLLWCVGFSFLWLLLLQTTGSRLASFSSCSAWAH